MPFPIKLGLTIAVALVALAGWFNGPSRPDRPAMGGDLPRPVHGDRTLGVPGSDAPPHGHEVEGLE